MTEMTARIRNKLQDHVIDWQEKRYRSNDFRQQQADLHRSRMTCSATLPSFRQTQDWTGGMTASGRVPVVEDIKPRQRLISADGIRWDAAVAALILVGVLLGALLLADLAGIGTGGRMVSKLTNSIQELEAKNERIQAEIDMNVTSASVCTEAVKLNLISSNGARTVQLTAPSSARLTLSTEEQAVENANIEKIMTSYAGD